MRNIVNNCEMCDLYLCQEIMDNDYGGIYENEPSCQEEFDVDNNTGEHIEGFDRNCERKCCKLSFCKIADIDKEIEDIFNKTVYDEEYDEYVENIDGAYNRFKEKYRDYL